MTLGNQRKWDGVNSEVSSTDKTYLNASRAPLDKVNKLPFPNPLQTFMDLIMENKKYQT